MNGDVEMVDTSNNEKVAILDAGAQYGKVYNILNWKYCDIFYYLQN